MLAPELIIFDCDGVLVDSEIIACAVDAEMLTALGLPMTVEDIVGRFIGMPDEEMDRIIEAELGRPLPDSFRPTSKERVLARFEEALRPIPGIHDLLTALPVPFCVASSSTPVKLATALLKTNLFDAFYPAIYSTRLVPKGKPAPDIFLYAAARMGVDPERCLVIEDSVAGVTAGVAAGMRVIGFTGGSHCPPGHEARLREAGAPDVTGTLAEIPARAGFETARA